MFGRENSNNELKNIVIDIEDQSIVLSRPISSIEFGQFLYSAKYYRTKARKKIS